MEEHRFAFQQLDVYRIALEFARRVQQARINDPELNDQATRAAKSTFLQICEGLPNESAGLRRKYFTGANNSLCEAVGALDLACELGALSSEMGAPLQEIAWRLKHMLRGLRSSR